MTNPHDSRRNLCRANPNAPAIQCEFFTWRLFRRDGVSYADGRGTTRDLGKHSKPTGTDTYCYSPEEVTAMLNRCWKEPKLGWLGDVILILSHTGMRIGEVEKLRWGDIDFANKVIQVADER